jgi:hypothetical protein
MARCFMCQQDRTFSVVKTLSEYPICSDCRDRRASFTGKSDRCVACDVVLNAQTAFAIVSSDGFIVALRCEQCAEPILSPQPPRILPLAKRITKNRQPDIRQPGARRIQLDNEEQ